MSLRFGSGANVWRGEMSLRDGWKRHACGHPFWAELSDGNILTAYYRWADPWTDPSSCMIEGVFWQVPR